MIDMNKIIQVARKICNNRPLLFVYFNRYTNIAKIRLNHDIVEKIIL